MSVQWFLARCDHTSTPGSLDQRKDRAIGPLSTARLLELAASGVAASGDWIWLDGTDLQITVERFLEMAKAGRLPSSETFADSIRSPANALPRTHDSLVGWLSDVAEYETGRPTQPPFVPEWLEDVRQSEKFSWVNIPIGWLEDIRQIEASLQVLPVQTPCVQASAKPVATVAPTAIYSPNLNAVPAEPPPVMPPQPSQVQLVVKPLTPVAPTPPPPPFDVQAVRAAILAVPSLEPPHAQPVKQPTVVGPTPPRQPDDVQRAVKPVTVVAMKSPPRPADVQRGIKPVTVLAPIPLPQSADVQPSVPAGPAQETPLQPAVVMPTIKALTAVAPMPPSLVPVSSPPSVGPERCGYDPESGRILNPSAYVLWRRREAQRSQEELTKQPNVSVAEAFLNAQWEIQEWVDADLSKPLVASGDTEAIRQCSAVQELLGRFEKYGPVMQEKLWKRLFFLVDNRKRFYKAFG